MTTKVNTMEMKKMNNSTVTTKDQELPKFGLWSFIGDVKTEFKKVTWTNREELQVYARIVVIATFMLGLGIYFADLLIQGWLSGFAFVFRWIGG